MDTLVPADQPLPAIRRDFRWPRSCHRQTTPLELVDENDVRHDLLPVVLWTDGRRLLFLVYGSEGVAAVQPIR
jgi:hypothetical protein